MQCGTHTYTPFMQTEADRRPVPGRQNAPGSGWQALEHPSPDTVLPSSQSSIPVTKPSPHTEDLEQVSEWHVTTCRVTSRVDPATCTALEHNAPYLVPRVDGTMHTPSHTVDAVLEPPVASGTTELLRISLTVSK
jgi:hypothetical protein